MMVKYGFGINREGHRKRFHNKASRFLSLVRLGYPTSQNNNFAKLDGGKTENDPSIAVIRTLAFTSILIYFITSCDALDFTHVAKVNELGKQERKKHNQNQSDDNFA